MFELYRLAQSLAFLPVEDVRRGFSLLAAAFHEVQFEGLKRNVQIMFRIHQLSSKHLCWKRQPIWTDKAAELRSFDVVGARSFPSRCRSNE